MGLLAVRAASFAHGRYFAIFGVLLQAKIGGFGVNAFQKSLKSDIL
jgi:hypothetical protein